MKSKLIKSIKNNINYIVILVIVCMIFMFLNIFFLDKIQTIDNSIIDYVKNHLRSARFLSSVKFITHFGDKIVFGIIITLMFISLKNKKYSIYMLINLVNTITINLIIKYSFKRSRPVEKLIEESGYSFPSGHTMCSAAFYSLLLYFILKNTNSKMLKIMYVFILGIMIIIIPFSRVYLNVHYLSDVVGGLVLGILCTFIFIKIINEMENEI